VIGRKGKKEGIQDRDTARRTIKPHNRKGKGQGNVIRHRQVTTHARNSKAPVRASNSVFAGIHHRNSPHRLGFGTQPGVLAVDNSITAG
jgi:hypothetical protein